MKKLKDIEPSKMKEEEEYLLVEFQYSIWGPCTNYYKGSKLDTLKRILKSDTEWFREEATLIPITRNKKLAWEESDILNVCKEGHFDRFLKAVDVDSFEIYEL